MPKKITWLCHYACAVTRLQCFCCNAARISCPGQEGCSSKPTWVHVQSSIDLASSLHPALNTWPLHSHSRILLTIASGVLRASTWSQHDGTSMQCRSELMCDWLTFGSASWLFALLATGSTATSLPLMGGSCSAAEAGKPDARCNSLEA